MLKNRKGSAKPSFRYLKGPFKISEQTQRKRIECFYYVKGVTFSVKNDIKVGGGLDLRAEPPHRLY